MSNESKAALKSIVGSAAQRLIQQPTASYEAKALRATIAEQQARLDAMVAIFRVARERQTRGVVFCLAKDETEAIEVLARGAPRRECAKLVKRYGKEKTSD